MVDDQRALFEIIVSNEELNIGNRYRPCVFHGNKIIFMVVVADEVFAFYENARDHFFRIETFPQEGFSDAVAKKEAKNRCDSSG